MVDAALLGKHVILERYNRPQAVLVNYKQWHQDQARLKELELVIEAQRLRDKLATGEMGRTSGDELLRLIMERRAHAANAPGGKCMFGAAPLRSG
jgi:hypothetical protein